MRTDYKPTDTLYHFFSTVGQNKAPIAPVGGSLKVYVNGSLSEVTAGAGLTVSFDGTVGKNLATVALGTAAIPPGSQCCLWFSATIDGIAVECPLEHFTVLAQGAEIAARGQLTGVSNGGGTLGVVGVAKAGDFVRMITGTSKGYKQMDALNTGTGVFTFRSGSVWTTNPAIGDWYEIISAPQIEPLAAADLAAGSLPADMVAINGDATSASRVSKSARGIVVGVIQAGANTTTSLRTNLGGTAAEQYDDRSIVFLETTTTVALRGVSKPIDSFTPGTPAILTLGYRDETNTLVPTPLPVIPAAGDEFVVL